MKRVLLFVVLGSLALTAPAQETVSSSVEVRGSQISLPERAHPMFMEDLNAYAGTYNMSNGQVMKLHRAGSRLYASIGNQPAKKLVAASSNEFVALDRQLRITLNPDEYGGVNGELMMLVPRSVASAGTGDEVRLVTFR